MNVDAVSRCAAQLYEGVACDVRWREALVTLARAAGATAACIVRSDAARAGTPARRFTVDLACDGSADLTRRIAEHIDNVDEMKASRASASICSRQGTAPVMSDAAPPGSARVVAGGAVRVRWFPLSRDESGLLALLLVSSAGTECTLPAPSLLQHLARAARLRRQMHALNRAAAVGQHVMERFTLPSAVVNGSVRPIRANQAGRIWLRDIERMPPAGNDELDPPAHRIACFARALCGGETSPRALLLPDGGGRRTMVIGVPLEGHAADDDGTPLALLVAHERGIHRPSWVPLLAATFSLSPAEQRLLEQMVFDDSLDSAVTTLGISKETARTHLKSIFAKTGTKRQANLMRMVTNVAQLH